MNLKPLSRSKSFFLAAVFTLLASSQTISGNNVPGVVTGELVHKTETSIFIKNGKTSQVEIGLTAIGSLMVLDGKKLFDRWPEKAAIGGGAGFGLSIIDGNSPKNVKQSLKMVGVGWALGLVLPAGWNLFARKLPTLIYDSNRPDHTVELIKGLALGSKIRVTYKNHQ